MFRPLLFTTIALGLSVSSPAANHTTIVQQASGANWDAAAIWNTAVAPIAGETYEAIAGGGPTRLRNPVNGTNPVFGGDSLTIDTGAELRFKSSLAAGTTDTTVTFPGGGLILNGGVLNDGDACVITIAGLLTIKAPSEINTQDSNNPAIVQAARAYVISAAIAGTSTLTLALGRTSAIAFDITSPNNSFSGDWVDNGGWLKGRAAGSMGSGNITITGSPAIPSLFDVDYDLRNPTKSLTLSNTNSVLQLDQNLTFGSVSINGTSLAPGVYTETQLAILYPSNIGAGSNAASTLTVVPEPASAVLVLLGSLGLASLRRRRP